MPNIPELKYETLEIWSARRTTGKKTFIVDFPEGPEVYALVPPSRPADRENPRHELRRCDTCGT